MHAVSIVLQNCGSLLEGPHWESNSQCLYFIDYINGAVHRWHPETKKHEKRKIDDNVGCVVSTKTPELLVITGKHRYMFLDWETGSVTPIAEVDQDKPENHFNDGKCDAKGRFWAGTVGSLEIGKFKTKQGSLYCLDTDKSVTKHIDSVDISNGLCWSSDDTTMYYIDSLSEKVDAFDFCLETGKLSHRRTVIQVPRTEGYPDGMTMDSEGMLWVACYDKSKINRYNPHTGEKLETIIFPCSYVTSCCFGGRDLDVLYVTTSRFDLDPERLEHEPLSGSLFQVTGLGVKGRLDNKFAG